MEQNNRIPQVEGTGKAKADNGSLAVSGSLTVEGDLVLGQAHGVLRSGYLLEVAELAAGNFTGREAELADMAAFCTEAVPPSDDTIGGGYWRWLAPAWSGKTALMARFALHPPEILDVLAFFITSRAAGRSDRTAFLSALQAQLREYLGQGDVDCGTQGQFLDALQRAATQASEAGRRLVLLVDGLDEDTGVETATTGYSIASLLPRTVPAGMRVVVAARPNPPVPSDVHEHHPLHTTLIDHHLPVSEAAQAVQQVAERDLRRLVEADGLGREIARLVAAADGGLSLQDLADLVSDSEQEVSAWDVGNVLGGSHGRSFQQRPAQWRGTQEEPVLLASFGHEELQRQALCSMPARTLAAYRDRIHSFVERWRAAEWPDDTPEYALVGYPQLLRQLQDAQRLTALAADPLRHERLWLTTGEDTHALAEIANAFRLHRVLPEPDLAALAHLALRRDLLHQRVTRIPADLVVTWAHLGLVRRALAVAQLTEEDGLFGHIYVAARRRPEIATLTAAAVRALPDRQQRARATGLLSQAMAAAGDYRLAVELAQPLTGSQRDDCLAGIARALSATGQTQWAMDVAGELTDSYQYQSVLEANIEALADASDFEQAVDLLGTLNGSYSSRPLRVVVRALISAGRHQQAVDLMARLRDFAASKLAADDDTSWWEEYADDWSATPGHDHALHAIALEVAATEDFRWALDLADGLPSSVRRDRVLRAIVHGLLAAGRHSQAIDLARTLIDPYRRALCLAHVAQALGAAGHDAQAFALAQDAAVLADARTARSAERFGDFELTQLATRRRDGALAVAAESMMWLGNFQQALHLVGQIQDIGDHVARLLPPLAAAGHFEPALALAQTAGSYGSLREVATALCTAGYQDQALSLSRRLDNPEWQCAVLVSVIEVLTGNGSDQHSADGAGQGLADPLDRVSGPWEPTKAFAGPRFGESAEERDRTLTELTRQAVDLTRLFGDDYARRQVLVTLVASLPVDLGPEVIDLARGFTDSSARVHALALVAKALACAGHREYATALAQEVAAEARMLTNPDQQARTLVSVVEAMAAAGHHQRAASLTLMVPDPYQMARATVHVVRGLITGGEHRQASHVAQAITVPHQRSAALALVAEGLAGKERFQEAIALVQSMPDRYRAATTLAFVLSRMAASSSRQQVEEVARAAVAVARTAEAPQQELALVVLAETFAAIDLTAQALDLARAFSDFPQRARVLASVARGLGQAGRWREADAIVRNGEPDEQGIVRLAVAEALASVGRTVQAADLARTLSDPFQQARTLAGVARAATAHGRHQEGADLAREALSLAEELHADQKERTQVLVVAALAAANQTSEATSLTHLISDSRQQGRAVTFMVEALVEMGRHEHAAELARTLSSPNRRARALLILAERSTKSHDRRELLAEALSVGEWILACAVLAQDDPEVLEMLGNRAIASGR
ncbi:hypothetical protein PV367_12825 [Streptomyces europaeiscabiei]|uniref:Uncharacterized protein n=1 Tax=Streptomyces europaeiscabiei TaxID=146819 RepID=A0AAJ2PNB5_9ACTN|nr:hypothetical protein [Streptomyces europaeiscabiei]MDX3130653.1 hypothetical protein [Streptomyces europaeiscabiei]